MRNDRTDGTDWKSRCKYVSDMARALSHEHRLMIVSLLVKQERSVGELEQLLELPQPAVSQQLARLRADNLVEARRDGRTIYYRSDRDLLNDLTHQMSALFSAEMQSIAETGGPLEEIDEDTQKATG